MKSSISLALLLSAGIVLAPALRADPVQDATKAPELFAQSAQVYVNYAESEVEKHFNFIRKFKAEELESYRK